MVFEHHVAPEFDAQTIAFALSFGQFMSIPQIFHAFLPQILGGGRESNLQHAPEGSNNTWGSFHGENAGGNHARMVKTC